MAPKQRNIRKRRALDEGEEEAAGGDGEQAAAEEVEKTALEDLKLLQKLRKRSAGISSSALAASRAEADDLEQQNELMEAYVKAQGGAQVLTEEQHMERYVEQEVAKRLGKADTDELQQAPSAREREELSLFEVPNELKAQLKKEISIPGLSTAITEVEVSREAKLKKIEETERIKRRLLEQDAGWAGDVGPGDMVAARVPRSAFVPQFGKAKPKLEPHPDLDPFELERRKRFVSERTPDPRKLKQLMHKRGGGGGGGAR